MLRLYSSVLETHLTAVMSAHSLPLFFPKQSLYPKCTMFCRLSARGQHWVPIIDPAIAAVPGVSAYDEGLEDSVFIRNVQGDLYLGQVRWG